MRYLLLIALFPFAAFAQQYSPDWRQDSLELIEDERPDAAALLLEEASERLDYFSDPIERINMASHLGDAFHKLGKASRAASYFDKALKQSLALKPAWRSLSSVNSVLELQVSTEDITTTRDLLQQTLDKNLIKPIAKVQYAGNVIRYIEFFDKIATTQQIGELINIVRNIGDVKLRKKILMALSEIEFAETESRSRRTNHFMPLQMDDVERFFWFVNSSKFAAATRNRSDLKQLKINTKQIYQRLSEAQQKQHRDKFRLVEKL